MATSPWYREGTAKFTKGSTTVTGTDTEWVKFVRAGDGIQGPDGKLYQITNVSSDTSLSIFPAYGGDTQYWTIPIQGYVKQLADAAAQLVRDFESGATEAIDAADRAKQSAAEAKASENLVRADAASAKLDAGRAQQAADDAVAVVTGGTASIEPEAGKIPIAGSDATIKQAWIKDLEFELDRLRVATNKTLYGDGPYPSLDLQFQGAKLLDPRVTFARSTPKWDYYGKQYGVNEPVFTDKGLLLEPQVTNLWVKSSNYVPVSTHYFGEPVDNIFGGTAYKVTKRGTGIPQFARIFDNLASDVASLFLVFEGTASVNIEVDYHGTSSVGALRISNIGAFPEGITTRNNYVLRVKTVGEVKFVWVAVDYRGEPLNTVWLRVLGMVEGDGNYIIFHHIQAALTANDLNTTPILTDGTQVTRAEDQFSVILGDWYSPNEGALVLKIGDGSALNRVSNDLISYPLGLVSNPPVVHDPDFKGVYFGSDSGVIRNVWVGIGGENRDAVVTHDIYPNDTLCLAWNHDTLTLAVNGEIVGTATDERVPIALQGALGFLINPNLGMQLPYLSFYNRALSDSEMIALTS